MKFKLRAAQYLEEIQDRRRNPVRAGTVLIYRSYLQRILPELGEMQVTDVDNSAARKFVAKLNQTDLAPSTVNAIFNLVKAVVASAVDPGGNEMYPRRWNPDFIDLPVVSRADQDTPTVTPEQITAAIRAAEGQDKPLLVMLAATGLRIGESLALQGYRTTTWGRKITESAIPPEIYLRGTYGFSYWDPGPATIWVKSTLTRGRVSPQPKTDAGIREIDLHPDVNAYLKQAGLPETGYLFTSTRGSRARIETLYDHLEDVGIEGGFHSIRRFRITHLEAQGVPAGIQMYWTGHSPRNVHESYIRFDQDQKTRREWALRAGYGFELPEA